ESMPEITIPLDQTKSVQSNMDDYFRKYKKYLTAERELHPRIEKAKYDLDTLRQELRMMESGTWTPSVAPIVHTDWHGAKPDQKRRDRSHRPFRRFLSADGLQILVGRNARENDELTFGLAKSDDLWLHARGTPGSHVVVRLNKGQDPPVTTLREAATLALLYSDLKKSGRGEILYTRRKWVKKAKGQTAGAVIVAREQSLHVTLDKATLALLKDRSRQEPP
ncbi:MAG TPA: NFACT RNA binding domain-containing protein, partial [Nitrospira sp.]